MGYLHVLYMTALLALAAVVTGQVMMDESSPLDNFLGRDTLPGGNETVGSQLTNAEQKRLNRKCQRKCKTEVCYLADKDCRNFITCKQDGTGGTYTATVQPCAFGTYWGGLQKQMKITCDIPDNVACKIDYCAGRHEGDNFDHVDGKCNTYWQCIRGKPEPRCCEKGEIYDKGNNSCVRDILDICHDTCSLKPESCLIPGTKTAYFDDNKCVTYWDCEERKPHPVCCKEGQRYDLVRGCITDATCKDKCPDQYKPDICLKPGIEKYSLDDPSCRTYMRCNAIEGDERWCCPSGYVFDSNLQECLGKTQEMNLNCNDICPKNYKEVCLLKPASRPDRYIETVFGSELERPCANGTRFNVSKCACGEHVPDTPDNSCRKEFSMLFDEPEGHNSGSEGKIEMHQIGTLQYGPKLNGKPAYKFGGNLLFKIPFFQSSYMRFFLKLIFLPSRAAMKQSMVSNCLGTDLKEPSLELALQNGFLELTLVTDPDGVGSKKRQKVTLKADYEEDIWNTLTAYYDGTHAAMLNEAKIPSYDSRQLNGTISVAAEGLDFGACSAFKHGHKAPTKEVVDGFVGSMAQLEFTKCVHDDWIKDMKARL